MEPKYTKLKVKEEFKGYLQNQNQTTVKLNEHSIRKAWEQVHLWWFNGRLTIFIR